MRKITALAAALALASGIGISGCQLLTQMAPGEGSSPQLDLPNPASQEPLVETPVPDPVDSIAPADSGEPMVSPTMEVPPPRD